mmetsp:Transcript_9479/g.33015  ORF Transcript_9479/g.33015 Transcript_9479/m.33015 type:complete len:146 (-) Transcript_9479:97-534(-)
MPSVGSFMTPKGKAISAFPEDKVQSVARAMLGQHVGSVVVLDATASKPVGIVTKSDVARAYAEGVPLEAPVSQVMSTTLFPLSCEASRDEAAEHLEQHHVHHAVIVDGSGAFVGVVSSWDVARECALDAKAWPWNRPEKAWPKSF